MSFNFKPIAGACIAVVAMLAASAASAQSTYYIDSLSVTRSDGGAHAPFTYLDEFDTPVSTISDGNNTLYTGGTFVNPNNPGAAGVPGAYYTNTTALAPKANGFMQFREQDGIPTNLQDSAINYTLRTDVTNTDNSSGLKLASDFSVAAKYAFTAPDAGSIYRLRLSDQTPDSAGNDIAEIGLVQTTSGLEVRVRKIELSANTFQDLDFSTSLSAYLGSATSITFSFAHAAGVKTLTPSFTLTDASGNVLFSEVLNADSPTLFNGENFTRAVIGASWTNSVPVVPEPGTWALMVAGLAGVGAVARRRKA